MHALFTLLVLCLATSTTRTLAIRHCGVLDTGYLMLKKLPSGERPSPATPVTLTGDELNDVEGWSQSVRELIFGVDAHPDVPDEWRVRNTSTGEVQIELVLWPTYSDMIFFTRAGFCDVAGPALIKSARHDCACSLPEDESGATLEEEANYTLPQRDPIGEYYSDRYFARADAGACCIDYTQPTLPGGIAVLLPESLGAERATFFDTITQSAVINVGVVLMLSVLAVSFFHFLSELYSDHGRFTKESVPIDLARSLFWGAYMITGFGGRRPHPIFGQVIAFVALFVSVVVVAVFTGVTAAALTEEALKGGVSGLSDMAGRSVCTIPLFASLEEIVTNPVRVVTRPTLDECLDLIEDHKVDGVVYDLPNLRYFARKSGAAKRAYRTTDVFELFTLGWIVPKDRPDILAFIDSSILDFTEREPAAWKELQVDWFGSSQLTGDKVDDNKLDNTIFWPNVYAMLFFGAIYAAGFCILPCWLVKNKDRSLKRAPPTSTAAEPSSSRVELAEAGRSNDVDEMDEAQFRAFTIKALSRIQEQLEHMKEVV